MLVYALALLATIVIETGLARVLLPRAWDRLRVDVPLLNLLSHPLLTWALWRDAVSIPTGEVLVMALEAVGYRVLTRLPWPVAILLSLVLNAVTWALGALIFP